MSKLSKNDKKILNELMERPADLYKLIKKPSEEFLIEFLKIDIEFIQYIIKPSYKIQMMAMKYDVYLITLIDKPCTDAQLYAVRRDPSMIQYMSNPPEIVQLLAIKKEVYTFEYMGKTTEKVKIAAVKKDPTAIANINRPSYEIQKLAMRGCRRSWCSTYWDSDEFNICVRHFSKTIISEYKNDILSLLMYGSVDEHAMNTDWTVKEIIQTLHEKRIKWPELLVLKDHIEYILERADMG